VLFASLSPSIKESILIWVKAYFLEKAKITSVVIAPYQDDPITQEATLEDLATYEVRHLSEDNFSDKENL
jgi:hypothetical protein